jgi:hypothetical protein
VIISHERADDQPFGEFRLEPRIAVIQDLRRFVDGAANAVAAKRPHRLEAAAARLFFDGPPDLADAITGTGHPGRFAESRRSIFAPCAKPRT